MTLQKSSLSEKIARAETALKSGVLNNYAPAASANSSEPKTPMSWGPAMRK